MMRKILFGKKNLPVLILAAVSLMVLQLQMSASAQAVPPENLIPSAPRNTKPPVQMIRALQHVHDAVARGEKGAVAHQAHLLGEIGRAFERADPQLFVDKDNLYALATYLFNGGNPDYVEALIKDIPADIIEPFLLDGALAYARGDEKALIDSLGMVELDKVGWGEWPLGLRLSAYLALEPHLALDNPQEAMQRLGFVRTVAPGSLFEESAMRRQVKLAALCQDADTMRRIIVAYANRFAASPYASDFWREVRGALPLLEHHFDDEQLAALITDMPPKVRYMVFLRIARTALLEGRMERAAFAATRALDEVKTLTMKVNDASARLYLAASLAASERADETLAMLADIKPNDLPANDRPLLDAVRSVAHTVAIKREGEEGTQSTASSALVQADSTPLHNEIAQFLTVTQEKLAQVDTLLEK